MFAIINKRTLKFVYGTDYRYHPYHQRTSYDWMLTMPDIEKAEYEFRHRQCGKDYVIVEIAPLIIDKKFRKDPRIKELNFRRLCIFSGLIGGTNGL
jgi:hypothetical protein